RGATSPRLLLELICARILLPGAYDDESSLLTRLERMERRLALAGAEPVGHPQAVGNAPGMPGGHGVSQGRAQQVPQATRDSAAQAGPGSSSGDPDSGTAMSPGRTRSAQSQPAPGTTSAGDDGRAGPRERGAVPPRS